MLDGQVRTWEDMEVGVEHRFPFLLPHSCWLTDASNQNFLK